MCDVLRENTQLLAAEENHANSEQDECFFGVAFSKEMLTERKCLISEANKSIFNIGRLLARFGIMYT